ncbi:MAG: DUF2336 domain-containing protein [Rhodospirillales bacterium]|jgi:uncharacterized protein (DUF2336 family)|nr:DUF2336 domain-containing protein [Rhodospirillales bacterium]
MGKVESMYLVRLARDRSANGRKAFADALSDLFLADGTEMTGDERTIIYEILHRVIQDIETAVRADVSRYLADQPDTPHELATVLAADEIDVAYPILTLSTVLLDEDLVEIARNRTIEHQVAIAERPDISELVSDVLVDLGDETVITALLKNDSAKIASATLEYVVEESKRVDAYQEPILRRNDLPPALAARMVLWVSAALRQYILDNFHIDEEVIDDALETTAMEIINSPLPSGSKKSQELAGVLEREGEISPELLISALRDGEMSLFVALFERITRLSENLIMDILLEPGGEGLAIACKATGIGKAYFLAIFSLIRQTRSGTERQLRREIRAAMALFDKMSTEAAREVAVRWRRNVGYLVAIRDLKIG